MSEITLHKGEPVPWKHAPNEIAQIDELRRRSVTIVYRTKCGTIRRPRVSVAEIAKLIRRDRTNAPPLPGFNINNPLGRGVRATSKTYPLT